MRRAALALLLLAAPALAEMRPADRPRMLDTDGHLGWPLLRALSDGAPADVQVLVGALAGAPAHPAPDEGDWTCRTLHLGGPREPLRVEEPVPCRVTRLEERRWQLESLAGPRRLLGTILEEDGFGTYMGVSFEGDAPAATYEELPPDEQVTLEPGGTYSQVGRFEQASPVQARLILPHPFGDSLVDVVWLSR